MSKKWNAILLYFRPVKSPEYSHQLLIPMNLFPFCRLISLKYWMIPVLVSCFSMLFAQNSPACFVLSTPVIGANPGDTVCVPVHVRDFEDIISMQFVVFYQMEGLKYQRVNLTGSELPGIGQQNFFHSTPGLLRFSWSSLSGDPYSLPDSAVLFHMCFVVQPTANGFYPFEFGGNFPTFYEVMQEISISNAIPLPLSQQIGGISTVPVSPNPLFMDQSCVQDAQCNQPNGSINVTIAGGAPPYQYLWSGPNGFSANTTELTGLTGGIYHLTVTDQQGNILEISIRVISPIFNLSGSVNTTQAFCGNSNGCAALTMSGNPPFFYQWSYGNIGVNSDSNCELPPGNYTVTVSTLSGCSLVQTFSIENDTTFYVGSSWGIIETCGGTADLTASVFGATGPLSYEWSNGATTASIQNLQEGLYYVTVTSLPGGCTSSAESLVLDVSTQSWLAELADHCDLNSGSLYLSYNASGTLSFPALISWSDGTTHLRQSPAAPGILDSLQDVPSGHYSVTITDANGCAVTLEHTMNCFQPAPVPDGYNWCYIDADMDPSDHCTGVYARHFQAITTLYFSIQYPGSSEFSEIKNLQLPGLSLDDFSFDPNNHTLGMQWQSPTALTLPDDQLLFEVCLTPSSGQESDELTFAQSPVPAVVVTQDGPQIFIGRNGWINYNMTDQPAIMACKAQGIAASCSSDGKAQILLGSCTPSEQLYGHYLVNYPNDSTGFFDDLSGLRFSDGGVYQISVYRQGPGLESWFASVPSIPASEECVWPGDADNNQAVNHHDLLYIGLAYGASGPVRSGASLTWNGQDAAAWQESSAVRQVNFKNIDTNGDGLINAADTLALVQNWGQVINPARDNPFHAPLESNNPGQNALISLQTDTLYPGDAVHLPLSLGSQGTPLEDIYGLAFSISYDPDVVKDNIRFAPTPSWFGDEGNYLCIQKNFPRQGRLDVAITRTDGIPVSGWGEIGNVFIIIEDNIFNLPDPLQDSIKNSQLFFSAISSADQLETPKELGAVTANLVIKKTPLVRTQTPESGNVILLPNPAQQYLTIRSTDTNILEVSVLRADGNLQDIWQPEIPIRELTRNLNHLPDGTYLVKILTEHGWVIKKLVILK